MGKIISNGINYSGVIHEYSPAIYSTEEREIGVWTDGKPIYKKVIIFSEPIVVSYTDMIDTTIDSSDIENIISAVGIHSDGTNYCGVLADPTRSNHTFIGLLSYRNGYNITVKKLILEYTKISDSPGSGIWTPSGVPAVHYSTDEHVVGTWIDGSTIYEKTQNGGIDFTQGDTWYDTTITGVDEVIEVKGTILRSGELIELGTFNDSVIARWILRDNTVKLSLVSIPSGDTFALKNITVKYTKVTT